MKYDRPQAPHPKPPFCRLSRNRNTGDCFADQITNYNIRDKRVEINVFFREVMLVLG